MAKSKNEMGKWAFLIGLVLSVILAFMPTLLGSFGVLLLVIFGLIVGALNIEKSESNSAILVLLAFPLIAAGLNAIPSVSTIVGPILQNVAAMLGGAAVVIVGKALWEHFSE